MRGADVAPPHSRFPAPTRSATRGLPTTRYGYEGSLYATVAVPLGRQAGVLSGPAVTPKAQDKTIVSLCGSRLCQSLVWVGPHLLLDVLLHQPWRARESLSQQLGIIHHRC